MKRQPSHAGLGQRAGADPADAAQVTIEAEEAARNAEIMERTYPNVGEAHMGRCRICLFPLYEELEPEDGCCSNTCRKRGEED